MSLLHRLALWATLLCAALPAQAALFQNGSTDLERELRLARQDGKQLVVLFELENCDACRQLRQRVLSDPNAERLFGRRFRTVTVNLDSPAQLTTPTGQTLAPQAWARQIGVLGTPALAFFDGKGQLAYRHLGALADCPELVLLGRFVATQEFENQPYSLYLQEQFAQQRAIKGGAKHQICLSKN